MTTTTKAKPIGRPVVEQWMRDNAPNLKTHITPGGNRGFYRKELGPAASFRGKRDDGSPFRTWREVMEFLIFES